MKRSSKINLDILRKIMVVENRDGGGGGGEIINHQQHNKICMQSKLNNHNTRFPPENPISIHAGQLNHTSFSFFKTPLPMFIKKVNYRTTPK